MEINEEEMIDVIRNHYATCQGNPVPLQALKQHYGREFNFKRLGLGNYGGWMAKHQHLFQQEIEAKERNEEKHYNISEEDILKLIEEHFSKSEMFSHRRCVLHKIRSVSGERPFGELGFGTFKEFQKRHNLDMGIARREDFRNEREWKKWKGRRG